MKNSVLALSLLLVLASCTQKEVESKKQSIKTTFNLETAKAEIEAANKDFMNLVTSGDSIGLANAYTIDAKFMSAGAPAVSGRKNIQSAMYKMVNSGLNRVDLRMTDLWGTEYMLVEEGELTLYAGETNIGEEKYIVVWKKEDGKWKLFRDIFNSNLPVK